MGAIMGGSMFGLPRLERNTDQSQAVGSIMGFIYGEQDKESAKIVV